MGMFNFKKFGKNENGEAEEDYGDFYGEELNGAAGAEEDAAVTAALNDPAHKDPIGRSPAGGDKVSLKLMRPKSYIEATKIADRLKEGSIVLMDIADLDPKQSRRLVDFLAGVAYVLGGEMTKTNQNTILVSPSGVDISSLTSEEDDLEVEEDEGGEAPTEEY